MTDIHLRTLPRIDASARTEGSVSRRLADAVQARRLAQLPGGRVRRRDWSAVPLPHIAAATIQVFDTPADQFTPALRAATALCDARNVAAAEGEAQALFAA